MVEVVIVAPPTERAINEWYHAQMDLFLSLLLAFPQQAAVIRAHWVHVERDRIELMKGNEIFVDFFDVPP